MKSKLILLFSMVFTTIILSGCCLKHEWNEATCLEPKTCAKCGATEGGLAEHTIVEATCTSPMTCSVCGKIKGEALGHNWQEATCTEPQTCITCGATKGLERGHDWSEANCLEARFCHYCGETDGEIGEHDWMEATCLDPEYCLICGDTRGERAPHQWIGSDNVFCGMCGATLPENGLFNGVASFKGASYILPDDFQLSVQNSDENAVYTNGREVFTMNVNWNSGISYEEYVKAYQNAIPGVYTILDEGEITIENQDFYCFVISHSSGMKGYCTIFWREDVCAYMECISPDEDVIAKLYPQVMATFEVI